MLLAGLIALWGVVLGFQIVATGNQSSGRNADVAIVLGAGVRDGIPSPVFVERIRHGVALYKTGRVRKLLLTGGHTAGEAADAESTVARRWAIRAGVPPAAILTEEQSRTTMQNFIHAQPLMRANGLRTALVVSDPFHMKRALAMAAHLGIDAEGSPTPTTRFRGWNAKAPFLLREIFFYNVFLLTGN